MDKDRPLKYLKNIYIYNFCDTIVIHYIFIYINKYSINSCFEIILFFNFNYLLNLTVS